MSSYLSSESGWEALRFACSISFSETLSLVASESDRGLGGEMGSMGTCRDIFAGTSGHAPLELFQNKLISKLNMTVTTSTYDVTRYLLCTQSELPGKDTMAVTMWRRSLKGGESDRRSI